VVFRLCSPYPILNVNETDRFVGIVKRELALRLIVKPYPDVISPDHSELGVRYNRFRWARGSPHTIMWTDEPEPDAQEEIVEWFAKKGVEITKHTLLPDYLSWTDG
jgi:hypothetical protein